MGQSNVRVIVSGDGGGGGTRRAGVRGGYPDWTHLIQNRRRG